MAKAAKQKKLISRILNFFKEDLWSTRLDDKPRPIQALLKILRIAVLSVKRFFNDKVQLRASGLTLYTLLALVPVLAIAFAVAKGMGFEDEIEARLIEAFQGQEEVLNWLISFAHSMLDDAKGGLIAGVGAVVLLWSVMKLLGRIEASFNDIWQVKKSRSYVRKFTDYLAIMLVLPILIIASGSMSVFITRQLGEIIENPIVFCIVKALPYVILWLLFSVLYLIMPNTRVSFGSAFVAGILVGTAFPILQWVYIDLQVGVAKNNAIYGSFAALPLLLVMMQMVWTVVLFGAEVSFVIQHIKYEREHESDELSPYARRAFTFFMLKKMLERFRKGEKPWTEDQFASELNLPIKLVRNIMQDLLESKLTMEIVPENEQDRAYIPATDLSRYTLAFVIEKLDNSGSNSLLEHLSKNLHAYDELQKKLLENLQKSPSNILIIDIDEHNLEKV